jgi:hypothetical protein
MKHLKATEIHFPEDVLQVKLKECRNLFPMETEQKWVDSLFKSLSEKGMKHPILICTEENLKKNLYSLVRVEVKYANDKWKVLVGNNRYHYAIQNNYTLIDAYEIKTLEDYDKFHNATVLEAHQF